MHVPMGESGVFISLMTVTKVFSIGSTSGNSIVMGWTILLGKQRLISWTAVLYAMLLWWFLHIENFTLPARRSEEGFTRKHMLRGSPKELVLIFLLPLALITEFYLLPCPFQSQKTLAHDYPSLEFFCLQGFSPESTFSCLLSIPIDASLPTSEKSKERGNIYRKPTQIYSLQMYCIKEECLIL